ncbi:MAG: glycosyltransferase [Candidatus Symbiothrix sp.]|jgi:glycosyltransferase involved in cell wall biosynthesis|nr:glycosyltransferase [Candidatus Symbiothrix sp.]
MENINKTEQPVVSIIIPVFNAADSLPVCIESLMNQPYSELELIFVNDCSTDNSLSVIAGYKERLEARGMKVKIIQHERNQGVAAARNSGLDEVSGKYIYWVDADDWIEKNAVEKLVEEAEKTDAEIIGCNWYLSFHQNERLMNQSDFSSPEDGLKKMMAGVMRWNLWLFMLRRELLERNHIRFIPGLNMGEDMMVMMKLFASAHRVSFLNAGLYHYKQTNQNSLSKIYSQKHIEEVTANVNEVVRFLEGLNLGGGMEKYAMFLKLNIKLPLLISDQTDNFRLWNCWFSEANIFVMKNRMLPLRTRLLQWFAAKRMYIVNKLYFRVVIRTFYGIIYK